MISKGSCLCGAARFEIEGALERFFICHCSRCRKVTGTAFAANLFTGEAELRWLSGADRVTTYTLPTTQHMHSFCATCGSGLPVALPDSDRVMIPAGCLDDALSIEPTAHIYLASQSDWEPALATAPGFDDLPAKQQP